MQASVQVMEQGLADGTYIDYWQEDDHFVCIRVTSIHEISDKVQNYMFDGKTVSMLTSYILKTVIKQYLF